MAKRQKGNQEDTPEHAEPHPEATPTATPPTTFTRVVSPPTFTTPTDAQDPIDEVLIEIFDSDEPTTGKSQPKPARAADQGTPTYSEIVMCAQRQGDETEEGNKDEHEKTAIADNSEDEGGEHELLDSKIKEGHDKVNPKVDKGENTADGGADGTEPRTTRDPVETPTTGIAREALNLPAGTSKDAADMIAAELGRRAGTPRVSGKPAVTSRAAIAPRPRQGATARGVTPSGNGHPSNSDMTLRPRQHKTVSRVGGRTHPEGNIETTQQLRAELLRHPGMPGQPGLGLRPRSDTGTPETQPELFPEPDESSDDEMEAREQAASECLRLIRNYDETAFETARGMRDDPKQRTQFLTQHYTPAHRSKRGKMLWPQVAARASYGFPTDRPIFEEAFPFHKWTKWSTPASTVTDTTLTGKAAQAARAEGFEGIDDPAYLQLIADAGHTPHRGNSPTPEMEMQVEAQDHQEEHGVNTTDKAMVRQTAGRQDGQGLMAAVDPRLRPMGPKGIEPVL